MSEIIPISIPDARDELRAWAILWNKPELKILADRLIRRQPKYPVAKATRRSLNPEMARNIRTYKARNPSKSNRSIGELFGVDGGRVSEAIHNVKG